MSSSQRSITTTNTTLNRPLFIVSSSHLTSHYLFSLVHRGTSLAMWLLFDHIQWLQKAGYLRLTSDTVQRIDVYHSQSWFVGLLFGAFVSLYKLQVLVKEERALLSTLPPHLDLQRNDVDDVRKKALLMLQEKKAKQVMGVVKNGTDLIIPAARLKWVDVSEGTVGLAGTITSVMGMYSTYPK
jgi:peroxin-11B